MEDPASSKNLSALTVTKLFVLVGLLVFSCLDDRRVAMSIN